MAGNKNAFHRYQSQIMSLLLRLPGKVNSFLFRLYIYGGYDNNEPGILSDFFSYSLEENKWEEVQQKGDLPGQRHSQVAVVYNDKMYMHGGMY